MEGEEHWRGPTQAPCAVAAVTEVRDSGAREQLPRTKMLGLSAGPRVELAGPVMRRAMATLTAAATAPAGAQVVRRQRVRDKHIPILWKTPAGDSESASHKLLLRCGMVRQVSAGVYSMLPVGLRVLDKIERIIDEEMAAVGAEKVALPVLAPKVPPYPPTRTPERHVIVRLLSFRVVLSMLT